MYVHQPERLRLTATLDRQPDGGGRREIIQGDFPGEYVQAEMSGSEKLT